ncbi:MAG TPA: adenylate/guanylate cyclase domain-containing protein [Candidatus Acidoferrum sp.]|nr:adenylate/guanylate cyclase domain-containing protein [Candidatus Acidoferrum sp.]
MTCQHCRFENPPGMRFCGQCGAALALRCPQCGVEAPPQFKFCGQCGASLTAASAGTISVPPADAAAGGPKVGGYTPKHLADKILKSRSALEGERRQVTVLFGDVAGFTTLAEHLDPEEVHRIINRCFELITAEVHRFEGTINQYTGDGIMALFGAPIAHEDSPRRAVHAALGIQRALSDYGAQLESERGLTLRMRVGLHTGPVVVGRIGDDLRMDYTAVGDTTNLAARMQQVARPGSVLVSEATHNLVAGYFETVALGETPVKGHAPVRAFEVLRARGRRARLDVAVERGLTPLVGRESELVTLLERFEDVKAGRGQVVSVVGEAGIGKSRLTLEFRRALVRRGEDVTWLEGRCVSFGQSIPFLPLIDQLRENFSIEEFDGEPEIIAKIEHGMRSMGQLDAHIPYVRTLLGVDSGDPAVAAMEPPARRRRVFEGVRALSARGSALRPIVFVVEDLHWIDANSEDYFGSFIDSLAGLRIMLILTYRGGYAPTFSTRSFLTTLNLRSLSEAESLDMATQVLGTADFPEQLRAELMDKAEGVPLFVEEVSKTLLDLGLLRRENGGLRFVKDAADVRVPDTIQDIIMARLDQLGEDGKRMVQLASVIGRQFLVRLLERIAGFTGELDGLLRELKALEIVYEQGLLPEPAYIFKHAVIQDVAYNSLLKERRRELHRAVGHAIEELYPDRLVDHAEELAHHFVAGEDWSQALDYLVQSGDKAKYAYANQAALEYYQGALEAAERARPTVPDSRVAAIHQRRGQVFMVLARYLDAAGEFKQMLALARAAGDRANEGQALVDISRSYFFSFRSEFADEARRCAEEARAIGADIGDGRLLAASLGSLGSMDQSDGDLEEGDRKFLEAVRLGEAGGFPEVALQSRMFLGAHANWRAEFRRAIRMSREAEHASVDVHDSVTELLALAFRCLSEIGVGDYSDGLATINAGLARAKDRNNSFIQGRLTNSLGWLRQELGDFRASQELDRESADIGQRINNPNVEISALINLAYDHLNLDDVTSALELLEDSRVRIEKFAFGAHRWRWSIHLRVYLAEALLAAGRGEEALIPLEEALVQARATGCLKYVGKAHALRAQIAAGAGRWSDAERDAADAVRIGRDIAHPTLMWQAAHALARAQRETGRLDEASATARTIVDTIQSVAIRAPEPSLRDSFMNWSRVQAALETAERLRRG